jgi:hypothetical protein
MTQKEQLREILEDIYYIAYEHTNKCSEVIDTYIDTIMDIFRKKKNDRSNKQLPKSK